MHRRRWVCEEHNASFSEKPQFIQHIREAHPASATPNQLDILIEMSERATDRMEIVPCPLCPDERRLIALQSHLAEHLESISLFVLPLTSPEDDDGDENDKSTDVLNPSSREIGLSGSSDYNSSRRSLEDMTSGQPKKDEMYCVSCHHKWRADQQHSLCPQCDSRLIQPLSGHTINLKIVPTWISGLEQSWAEIEFPDLPCIISVQELLQKIHDATPSMSVTGQLQLRYRGRVLDSNEERLEDIIGLDRVSTW